MKKIMLLLILCVVLVACTPNVKHMDNCVHKASDSWQELEVPAPFGPPDVDGDPPTTLLQPDYVDACRLTWYGCLFEE